MSLNINICLALRISYYMRFDYAKWSSNKLNLYLLRILAMIWILCRNGLILIAIYANQMVHAWLSRRMGRNVPNISCIQMKCTIPKKNRERIESNLFRNDTTRQQQKQGHISFNSHSVCVLFSPILFAILGFLIWTFLVPKTRVKQTIEQEWKMNSFNTRHEYWSIGVIEYRTEYGMRVAKWITHNFIVKHKWAFDFYIDWFDMAFFGVVAMEKKDLFKREREKKSFESGKHTPEKQRKEKNTRKNY